MGVLIWLLVGGLVGWIASMASRSSSPQGLLADVAAGSVGALLGGWLITPLLDAQTPMAQGHHGSISIFASLAGAVVLLAAVKLLRRGSSD